MVQKQVKIIGFSINEQFGALKATNLTFDTENRLTFIKGEVGAGKTTMNRGLRLVTQGSEVLEDKSLYGDNIDLAIQLLDGETSVYIGCKSKPDGGLDYVLYTIDAQGKKIKTPVIDGVKATPAAYLKRLQTALTWRLPELTSENSVTQRNILLELYRPELEARGVIFDKSHPNYVGGIIDKIEKAKQRRDYLDGKRKEVGGIADDLSKKGIDYTNRLTTKDLAKIVTDIAGVNAEITLASTSGKQQRESKLNSLKAEGLEAGNRIRVENDKIKEYNSKVRQNLENWQKEYDKTVSDVQDVINALGKLNFAEGVFDMFVHHLRNDSTIYPVAPEKTELPEVQYNVKQQVISSPEDFDFLEDKTLMNEISIYREIASKYTEVSNQPDNVVDTTELQNKLKTLQMSEASIREHNEIAIAVNAFHDWRESNDEVKDIKKDYFMKLTEINTGVEGLFISPEFIVDATGEKIAKDNDIYLMYDGSYDPEYFHNPKKELRKLSSYSDTQKPMIVLLVQRFLLSKKSKALPYLWIDQVPIDNKTRLLLDRMADELDLWLFVNWTGDFEKSALESNEILIEGGEIFFQEIE